MSVLKKKPRQAGEISMASTSDVAFLLLIFFIVTTIFAAQQGLHLVLPGKEKKAEDVVKVKESNVATLRVHQDNAISYNGQGIQTNAIMKTIEEQLFNNPDLVVILEIHPDADYGMMVTCLDEVRLANARKVSLKTTD